MKPLRGQIWNKPEDKVGDQIWDAVGSYVWWGVRDQLNNPPWGHIAQILQQVRSQVGDNVYIDYETI